MRDVNGVPILTPGPGEDPFYEEGGVEVRCVQPILYDAVGTDLTTTVVNPVDKRDVYLIPLQGEGSTTTTPVPADTACLADGYTATEVELERLNLVRTSDAVLWKKLVDVGTRLADADKITLDGAGRITTWTGDPLTPSTIDASPDQAAIYGPTEGANPAPPPEGDGRPGAGEPGGLMDTGTVPHWPAEATSPELPLGFPAQIGGFDNWDLAAAAVGTAAGKPVPITVDTIEYYNRIAAPDGGVANWGYADTVKDGGIDVTVNGEKFVDYSKFRYTRSEVFTGCTTWLDVGTLTWKSDSIMNRVEFTDIVAGASSSEVTNVAGFAQLADDVRSVIGHLHENEVVVNPVTGEGFFIDPVFEESCTAQAAMVKRLNSDADLARLMVTITSGPEDGTTDTSATFEFKPVIASIWIGPDVDVFCELDGLGVEPCESRVTYSDLTVGDHTFTVFATDGTTAGLLTVYTWTVVAPDLKVTITKKPAELTYDTSATFEFDAVEEGVVFSCTLDGGEKEDCTSPMTYPVLTVDKHTFTVKATDGANVGPSAIYEWEVLAPDLKVTVTSAPENGTYVTSATFVFEADEAGRGLLL